MIEEKYKQNGETMKMKTGIQEIHTALFEGQERYVVVFAPVQLSKNELKDLLSQTGGHELTLYDRQ